MKKWGLNVLLFISLLLGFSCDQHVKPEFFKLSFIFDKPLEMNKGELLPSSILNLSNYYEITDEDSKCYGKIFAPEIEYKRVDLNKKEDIGVPLSAIGKAQLKAKTLSKINLKTYYNLNKLKVTKLLTKKKKEEKNDNNSVHYDFMIDIHDKNDKIEKLRKKIEEKLCEGEKNINIYVSISKKENENIVKLINKNPEKPKTQDEEIGNKKTETENPKINKPKKEDGLKYKYGKPNLSTPLYSYYGGLKNRKPHGTGTMVFLKDGYAPVPKYSTEQIPVKKGQQLTGRFINGKFVSGDLLDENGNKIKSIYIGN